MGHGSANAPGWLVARPIAHRGLHDRAAGRPENTLAAALAAVEAGYAIECDVQASADGEAMVFHDERLGRLTAVDAGIGERQAADLETLAIMGSAETIPSLPRFLSAIAGRTPLVIEIKSLYSGDLALTRRVAELAKAYDGPVALKSFDPGIVAALVELASSIPRGIVAETTQDDPVYARMPDALRRSLRDLLHIEESRPDFLSWRVGDIPCAPTHLCRVLASMPVITWTVRTPEQVRHAAVHADQMVFEGFRP